MGDPPHDPTRDPDGWERYARAAAGAAGLAIEEAWWPGVVRHLSALLDRAASLDDAAIDLPDDPAPVFES